MREMLQRQLQDTGAATFSTANLNDYLNMGLQFMESAILAGDPEAFLEISTTNLVTSGDYPELYPKPIGLITVMKVEVDEDGSGYAIASKYDNWQLDDFLRDGTSVTTPCWADKGRWIRIYPVPTVAVADGIRLTFVPTLTMGADTDVPDLPLALHRGIVYAARIDALGDTDEDMDAATLDTLTKKLAIILDRIPMYYGQSHSEPDVIQVGIDHEDGWV